MFKRLISIKEKLRRMNQPEARIIYVELCKGVSREEAQKEYELANNLPPGKPENYIFINIPSDEQIRERSKKEFSNNSS